MSDGQASLSVRIVIGEPFLTGETCPSCGFDSMIAALVIYQAHPSFLERCARTSVCHYRRSEP
ncbi:hypothetical protein SAMN04488590_0227 [Microbacterium sp. 77mftsu3.1]|nr:hypothetical protein SAMN04488590_0227 [Microbacterium sp. 77mftsu3.1]